MRREQWRIFKAVAKGAPERTVPVALIVDSPWIPGYLGINHLDYYLDPDLWFRSNRKVIEQFPEVIFVPSWWIEYGMAIEPSALGARICFWPDRTPDIVPTLHRIEDAGRLAPVNPWSDGLMALALRRYQTGKQRIFEAGYTIPFATARGPLTVASFLRGLTAFMLDLTEQPEAAHALLNLTTNAIVAWLKAQQEAIGDCVEGIFVLDDIPGMLSRRLYLEFAHPYLKRICDAFPGDWVKLYHNDANIKPFVEDLTAVGFDALNWSHKFSVADIRQRTAGKLCLMGNVPPLEVGVKGTPGQVREAALQALSASGNQNFILSLGGGVSPGMPESNIRALVDACGA